MYGFFIRHRFLDLKWKVWYTFSFPVFSMLVTDFNIHVCRIQSPKCRIYIWISSDKVSKLDVHMHDKWYSVNFIQTTLSMHQSIYFKELISISLFPWLSVGMHDEAVDCHLRGSNPKAAVDCCVVLNRWDLALELAEKHDFPQVCLA